MSRPDRPALGRLPPVKDAVERAIALAGGQNRLARLCQVAPSYIWRAKESGRVSNALAIKIAEATEGKVSIGDLLPEVVDTYKAEAGLS